MASIHGGVFLIVGIIVGGISFFSENLSFFVYIGGLFVLYGVGKLFFSRKPKETKVKQPEKSTSLHRHPHTRQEYKLCPKCGYHNHTSYHFCPRCGFQLR